MEVKLQLAEHTNFDRATHKLVFHTHLAPKDTARVIAKADQGLVNAKLRLITRKREAAEPAPTKEPLPALEE